MRIVVCALLAQLFVLVGPVLAEDQTNPTTVPAATAPTPPTTTQTVPTLLGSKVTGLKLVDNNSEHIGAIKDSLLTGDRVQQYVISMGGVAGLGEKVYAVEPGKVAFENDVKGNLQAKVALTKDEVQQLGEYKY